jgi:hypothetical protein
MCAISLFLFLFNQVKNCYPWNCAPKRSFDVMDMGIPDSYFPEDINMNVFSLFDFESSYTDARNASMECTSEMHIVYTISRLTREKFAENDFNDSVITMNKYFFEIDGVNQYKPIYSSEYLYYCGQYQGFGYMCKFSGRYDEFVISYLTSTDAGIEQVDAVVQYLDERMGKLMRGEEVEDWREVKVPYWEEWADAESEN